MATDPAVLELARLFVLRKFTEAANAGSAEEQMPILTEVAELITDGTKYRAVLAEFAEAGAEEIDAQRTARQVQHRQETQQLRLASETMAAALKALAPPNRAERRKR